MRVRGRRAPIRSRFMRSRDDAIAPLASMLRGGRGGEVRLKLYLSAIWMAGNSPYDVTFPARAWAELLGLTDPNNNGSRRIADAMTWLDANGFIKVERVPGQPSKIVVLDDGGRGSDYRPPWSAKDRYVQLPPELWTKGWMAVLRGRALALLLILLDQQDFRHPARRIWLSPRVAEERYDLSPDTWTKGTAELQDYGVIDVTRRPVREDFGWTRVRKTYSLDLTWLEAAPDASLDLRLGAFAEMT